MRTLWRHLRLATCDAAGTTHDRGAIVTRNGVVEWAGDERELPAGLHADRTVELAGRWVTPGLVDCHTHLVFAGQRAAEFARHIFELLFWFKRTNGAAHSWKHVRLRFGHVEPGDR